MKINLAFRLIDNFKGLLRRFCFFVKLSGYLSQARHVGQLNASNVLPKKYLVTCIDNGNYTLVKYRKMGDITYLISVSYRLDLFGGR